jgi:hypothetical protein
MFDAMNQLTAISLTKWTRSTAKLQVRMEMSDMDMTPLHGPGYCRARHSTASAVVPATQPGVPWPDESLLQRNRGPLCVIES